ncbi:MAG: DNA-protecting protein DprA [Bdellovibrionaceae bacterium]|nr:DNA-protecting protein DprA [Bdellovibrionales bacterium]MCB9082814.1 DNA-protecting protein DprA [Pseudobdellovibrionaceae bacterium]
MKQEPDSYFYLSYLHWQTRALNLGHFVCSHQLQDEPQYWFVRGPWPVEVLRFFAEDPQWWERAREYHRRLESGGVRCLVYGQPDYPQDFLQLDQPPLVLTYMGSSHWTQGGHLAVVGSRNLSGDSRSWLEKNLRLLFAEREVLVLSGGARGTDQVAHSLCLRSERPTAVFLPSGILNPYPQQIGDWYSGVLAGGGSIVSPFAPWERMQKQNFHQRNHLIASLSKVVLAVDACRRSGTMITARAAMNYGRTVAVLPGHPNSEQGLGGLDLVYDGATPLRDHVDLAGLL